MHEASQRRFDRYYMGQALFVARGSKCVRAKYGTIIVGANGHVVSQGYNGKPAGSCNDDVCYREGLPPSDRTQAQCCIHSEENALLFCTPADRMGATLYVSGVPCKDCALRIMQSGIRRLVYLNEGMHVGSTPDEFWEKYGFGQDRLERVPMTTPEVFENETQESLTAQ